MAWSRDRIRRALSVGGIMWFQAKGGKKKNPESLGNSPLSVEPNLREGKREKMKLEQRAGAELEDHRPREGA